MERRCVWEDKHGTSSYYRCISSVMLCSVVFWCWLNYVAQFYENFQLMIIIIIKRITFDFYFHITLCFSNYMCVLIFCPKFLINMLITPFFFLYILEIAIYKIYIVRCLSKMLIWNAGCWFNGMTPQHSCVICRFKRVFPFPHNWIMHMETYTNICTRITMIFKMFSCIQNAFPNNSKDKLKCE